ncbi:tripartite tricarboxylate transporter substrate binding protein [Siccirubricoccus sp. KC 17139]|uniref:Tripartite tricarboxylate transporter substrate binding protein n=1 Tax=Siccirubricoccus soli TaxID=2899147 RepID=A0ABT1CYU6_9PROT|nr:tripartite tricarboxylate transporter substrate binding protein [Siccirubricoccus soli]MCO6414848.1 tripartite tricarboxylate transporter substrate binding protein [Siccirubricoccus soli]MCP2680978.1 tripartite tricarboxylate transporter substrate binding protein [Siccirubricoccus soli]
MIRRHIAIVAALLALATTSPGTAQERTVRILSGASAGGSSDFVTRVLADALGPILGVRAVVENRTGVNGIVAAQETARSAPDGSTTFICPMSTMSITPQLLGANLPIDPGTELLPIANVALSSYGFVVAANGPYRSVQDVLSAARVRPGQVTFASAGVGSAQHLQGELLKQKTGVDMVHVPYRGASPAIVDILGGRTDFMITNMADVTRHVQEGALRLLAISDEEPFPLFPDVPPLSRLIPSFNVVGWFALCGQKAMAPELVDQLEAAVRRVMADPAVIRRMAEGGLTPRFEDRAAITQRLANDRALWLGVIRAVNLRAS